MKQDIQNSMKLVSVNVDQIAGVCSNKQRWNKDKCRCQCKEFVNKGIFDKGFTWNLSNCESECDKSCDFGKHLEYKNYKCRIKSIDKLIEVVKVLMKMK